VSKEQGNFNTDVNLPIK